MESLKEQRIYVKFCFTVRKRAEETQNLLREAHGDNAVSQTTTYEWSKSFKNGGTWTDDDEGSGQTSRSELLVAQVKNIFRRKSSIDSPRSCKRSWNIDWFMPYNFNGKSMNASGLDDLLQKANDDDNLLKNVIFGYEA
jgi:hypothetical protein